MVEKRTTGQPDTSWIPPDVGDDPDEGQVKGPHGESPEDPAARGLYRGCLTMVLVLAIFLVLMTLLYRVLFT